jgi:hypothetical protein
MTLVATDGEHHVAVLLVRGKETLEAIRKLEEVGIEANASLD